MENFKKISPQAASYDPVREIGTEWMLISAKKADGSVNTMTASWGGIGVLWGKTVAFCFIRPQRYTLEFVKEAEDFSLSFFGGDKKDALTLCGRKSGRDCDKIKEAGLTLTELSGVPAFGEATKVLKVKKLYADIIRSEGFLDPALEKQHYPGKDYHVVYVAEILEVFERED